MSTTDSESADFLSKARAYEGREVSAAEPGVDPVNQPMIRHWVEAMGDANPVYTSAAAAAEAGFGDGGVLAPTVMLQAWSMRGIKPRPATGGSAQDELLRFMDAHGFSSVVATNCDQTYVRPLRPGDHLSETKHIVSVSQEKKTVLGNGHFVTTRSTYTDQTGEIVGTMEFRILKFRPQTRPAVEPDEAAKPKPLRPRPSLTHDNKWWFDACKEHRLLIQRCTSCQRLRHPTRPVCPGCGSFEFDGLEANGHGVVYSFVVNHYPQVPSFDYPLAVGLIELEEGTRLVANIVGLDTAAITVGMAVEVEWADFDPDLTLPQFRPATPATAMPAAAMPAAATPAGA